MKIALAKGWEMKEYASERYMPAAVPGSVYLDMLANQKMGDPFYRDNEKGALEIISHDYEYRTVFDVPEEMRQCDRILLRFDGIDTLSSVRLNGQHLGETDNMHRIWEFPVKELLKEAGNELHIILHSPTEYIAQSYAEKPIEGCSDAMRGLPRLRKAHCMFGWDWVPGYRTLESSGK